jgi:hypothetical protein
MEGEERAAQLRRPVCRGGREAWENNGSADGELVRTAAVCARTRLLLSKEVGIATGTAAGRLQGF